jgi:uncharacterized protein YutE (UPF0331/DUF86 family)
MVISNLNIKLIEDRIGFINKAVVKLKRLSALEEDVFPEGDTPAIAESYLRRSLEAIFDIGRHIIAKTAGKAAVEYKEIAKALGENGVVSKKLAEKLILMAGYRNRLIHFYHEVSDTEIYVIIKNHLNDVEEFVKEIKTFIQIYRTRFPL